MSSRRRNLHDRRPTRLRAAAATLVRLAGLLWAVALRLLFVAGVAWILYASEVTILEALGLVAWLIVVVGVHHAGHSCTERWIPDRLWTGGSCGPFSAGRPAVDVKTPENEAHAVIAGMHTGMFISCLPLLMFLVTEVKVLQLAGLLGFLVNAYAWIPLPGLDGSRAVAAMSKTLWLVGRRRTWYAVTTRARLGLLWNWTVTTFALGVGIWLGLVFGGGPALGI